MSLIAGSVIGIESHVEVRDTCFICHAAQNVFMSKGVAASCVHHLAADAAKVSLRSLLIMSAFRCCTVLRFRWTSCCEKAPCSSACARSTSSACLACLTPSSKYLASCSYPARCIRLSLLKCKREECQQEPSVWKGLASYLTASSTRGIYQTKMPGMGRSDLQWMAQQQLSCCKSCIGA